MLLVNDLCRQVVTNKGMELRTGGLQQRDFISMDMFVNTFNKQFTNGLGNGMNGVFNVGSGMSLSVLEMAQKIQQRCQIILGFEPALETQSCSAKSEQNFFLEYRTKRLAAPETVSMNAEIDRLLRFCESTFV